MTRRAWGLMVVGWLSVAAAAGAAEPATLFSDANSRYQAGQFADAASGYRAVLARGIESGPLYYNLGNALARQGRLADAVWAYLRAERLTPRDPDVRANLAYARSLVPAGDEAQVPQPRWLRWVTLGGWWAMHELLAATIVLAWIVAFAWIAHGWRPRPALRRLAAIATICCAVCAAALVAQTRQERTTHAVITAERLPVTFAPAEHATTHFVLPQGAVVRVLDVQSEWLHIRRRDGTSGWIPRAKAAQL